MRKLILSLAAVLVLLAVVAAGAVYWLFSGDGLRLAIEQQATAFLGQPVKVGRASVNSIQVIEGLHEGDTVILSDMSRWDNTDRIRLD